MMSSGDVVKIWVWFQRGGLIVDRDLLVPRLVGGDPARARGPRDRRSRQRLPRPKSNAPSLSGAA